MSNAVLLRNVMECMPDLIISISAEINMRGRVRNVLRTTLVDI